MLKGKISLTVRNKLYIGFIAIAMLTVVVGLVGYTQLASVNNKYDYILENINVVMDSSMEMIISVHTMAEASTEYVSYAYADSGVADEFHEHIEEFDGYEKIAEELSVAIDDDDLHTEITDVAAQHSVVVEAGEDMMAAYDDATVEHQGDMTYILAQVDPFMEIFDAELSVLLGHLDDLEHFAEALAVEADAIAEQTVSTANTMLIGVAAVAVVVAVALGVIISRGITNPLTQLISDSNIVADGNLGHEFQVQDRNDEIGEMITSVKNMVQNTASLVGNVQTAAGTVVGMAQDLSSTAQQANATMQQVSSATQQIASGSNQLSNLAQQSSGNANQLSAVLQQTGANSEKAGESIQQIMASMKRTSDTVEGMDQALEKIGNLANLVTDVASQTQLLALNAAIEAARAGEAGRGFAVVADAVKGLSEQTSQAATDTLASVSEVQKSGKDAMTVAQESTEEASSGVAIIQETIEGVANGVSSIEAVVKAIDEIASIAEESAASAEENTAAAEEQTASMAALADNATKLEELATELQQEMAKFTL